MLSRSYDVPNANGWKVYFLSIIAKVNINGKEQEALIPQTVFVKGKRITLKLMKRGQLKSNGKRGRDIDYAKILKPKVPEEAYDKEHLLYGSLDAHIRYYFFQTHSAHIVEIYLLIL